MRPVSASDLSAIEPLLINRARHTVEHKTLMTSLVDRDPLPEGKGRTKHAATYGSVEAYDVDEGVDIDNPQLYSITDATFTPTEIAAQVILTDRAVRTSGENQVEATGTLLGNAMSRKKDKKALALFDLFTTHVMGDGTTNITASKLSGATVRLHGFSEPVDSPIYAVLRPEHYAKVLDSLAPIGTYPPQGRISEEIISKYLAHDLHSLGLKGGFWSGNIARTSPGTVGDLNTSAKGAVFARDAIKYVPAGKMEIEKERLVRARSWLFQSTDDFVFGIFKQGWGVEMNYLAADPS